MLATVPRAQPTTQAAPMYSTTVSPGAALPQAAQCSPAAVLLGLLQPAKAGQCSSASTRATSPSSSTGDTASSEDAAAGPSSQRKQTGNHGGDDAGALARRRGRSVLVLSELVIDVEGEGVPGGSPSEESTSSFGVARGNSSRCTPCTPCTPQMMGFSPPRSTSGNGYPGSCMPSVPEMPSFVGEVAFGELPPAAGALLDPVPEQSMMRTGTMQKSADASHRSPARLGRAAACGDASDRSPASAAWFEPFGGAAATSDASQRSSVGRVSLGVAAVGGDASQRSPPGCTNRLAECSFARLCSVPRPMAMRNPIQPQAGSDASRHNSNNSGNAQFIAGTRPDASGQDSPVRSTTVGDASQRSPAGQDSPARSTTTVGDASQRSPAGVVTNLTVEGCNDVVRSWLAGASSNGLPVTDDVILEQLRAVAPEAYED